MKPKGAKYRNLHERNGVIYYERIAHGRRIKLSTKTASWEDAVAFRDLFEAHKGIGKVPFFSGQYHCFEEFSTRCPYVPSRCRHRADRSATPMLTALAERPESFRELRALVQVPRRLR